MAFNYITAEEAAEMIKNGDSIGTSGFTAPGSPKFISQALAAKAEREHAAGREFKVNVFTGASTSDKFDGVLARANAINMRITSRPWNGIARPRIKMKAQPSTALA